MDSNEINNSETMNSNNKEISTYTLKTQIIKNSTKIEIRKSKRNKMKCKKYMYSDNENNNEHASDDDYIEKTKKKRKYVKNNNNKNKKVCTINKQKQIVNKTILDDHAESSDSDGITYEDFLELKRKIKQKRKEKINKKPNIQIKEELIENEFYEPKLKDYAEYINKRLNENTNLEASSKTNKKDKKEKLKTVTVSLNIEENHNAFKIESTDDTVKNEPDEIMDSIWSDAKHLSDNLLQSIQNPEEDFNLSDDSDESYDFSSEKDVIVTKKRQRNPVLKVTCNMCGLVASCRSAYKTHLLRKHSLVCVYGCILCDMKYHTNEQLMKHRQESHKSKNGSGYDCPHCTRSLFHFHKLIRHIRNVHGIDVTGRVEYYVEKSSYNVLNAAVVFKTPLPKRKPRPKVPPKNHSYVCHLCGKVIRFAGQFKEHMLKHEDIKNYICDVCSKAFISKRILSIHKKIHAAVTDRKYVCNFVLDEGNKTDEVKSKVEFNTNEFKPTITQPATKKPQGISSAYITVDENGRRVCKFACVSHSDLSKHRLVHLSLRPHGCTLCGAKFRQSAHLKRHIKRHAGARDFKCSICRAEFVTKDNLNNHEKTHLHKNVEQIFTCEKCSRTFGQRAQLMRHIVRCNVVLNTNENLTVNVHDGLAMNSSHAQMIDQVIIMTDQPQINLQNTNVIN